LAQSVDGKVTLHGSVPRPPILGLGLDLGLAFLDIDSQSKLYPLFDFSRRGLLLVTVNVCEKCIEMGPVVFPQPTEALLCGAFEFGERGKVAMDDAMAYLSQRDWDGRCGLGRER
jgi:hypothetical protein